MGITMLVRGVISVLWVVTLAALAGALRLPKVLDIYIGGHRFVVSKRSIIVFILVGIVAPLVLITIKQAQTGQR